MPAGWNLRRAREELVLESGGGSCSKETSDYEYVLSLPGAVKIPELGTYIEARIIDIDLGADLTADISAVPEHERGQLLNVELIPKQIVIRNWRPGDRFWPAYTSAEKKVKELLGDRHATGAQKKLWPVAVAEGCGLIWLRDFAVPEALRAPTGARQALWIREAVS
jgi:tRNA(Ile)-lysidine synthase